MQRMYATQYAKQKAYLLRKAAIREAIALAEMTTQRPPVAPVILNS
jgi:hypothetical protein